MDTEILVLVGVVSDHVMHICINELMYKCMQVMFQKYIYPGMLSTGWV